MRSIVFSIVALVTVIVVVASQGGVPSSAQNAPPTSRFTLEAGQRVFFVGNTFAERIAQNGYFEAAMQIAHPGAELVVRSLGWSGDEVDLQPRPANFGKLEEHLEWNDAQVLFLCFGLNESFAGEAGLSAWRDRLTQFVGSLNAKKFDGENVPRMVLVSPIAHEDLGPPLPTGPQVVERNRVLALYCDVMKVVAGELGLRYIDLFTPSHRLMTEQTETRLTMNGIHPTEVGYYHVSRWMAESLGWVSADDATAALDAARPNREAATERLRAKIVEKNHHFFLLWRPLSPFYIWGGRAYCWKKDEPMIELERIAQMVDDRDREIWSSASQVSNVADVWAVAPGERELWETTPDYTDARAGSDELPPQLEMVRRNGVIK